MKTLFRIVIHTKKTDRYVCVFYVKAHCLADAAVYAENYLVAEALTVVEITTSIRTAEELTEDGYEIYEAE